MKQKLYDFLTLWITISVLFFIVNYATNIINVVTLGGMFAGSFIVGFITYLGLCAKTKVAPGPILSCGEDFNIIRLLEAWLCMTAFCHEAVLMTTRILPGWTYDITIGSVLFILVVLPFASIYIDQIVCKEGKNGH